MRITARFLDGRRRTPEEITTLARRDITGELLVTADEQVIKSAFYMMTAMISFTPGAIARIGAFIGDRGDAVRGRAMNGYPIFTSIDFLHKADVEAYDAERNRMWEALGVNTGSKPT